MKLSTTEESLEMVSVETVTERIGGHILASTVRPATEEDVRIAREEHARGECKHNVVEDTSGWLYDTRSCYICGKGLGTV